MQIVVAQYGDSTILQGLDKPQDLQRLRTTVHQITDKPEPVAGAIKIQMIKQSEQGRKTALYISNSINGHACLAKNERASIMMPFA
jgi:hypothetical protein